MKRLIALFMSLLIVLSALPALAAPTRDRESLSLKDSELQALKPLLDSMVLAAAELNERSLNPGTAPQSRFAERALVYALNLGLFPAEGNADSISKEEALKDFALLFESAPALSDTFSGGLPFREPDVNPAYGVYAYRCEEKDGVLSLYGDVYRLEGIQAEPQDAPEESLHWEANIRFELKREAASKAGFLVSGFAMSEPYTLTSWQNYLDQENGYELSVPDFLALPASPLKAGEALNLENQNLGVSLSVERVNQSLEALSAQWASGMASNTTANGQLEWDGEGIYKLAVQDGETGSCFLLSLSYPANRAVEFHLYICYLRNSFVVYSNSVG